MKNKIAFFFLAIVGTGVLWAVGFIGGATWGPDDFVALGLRGYEATGAIGAWTGIILGIVISFLTYRKLFCRKSL